MKIERLVALALREILKEGKQKDLKSIYSDLNIDSNEKDVYEIARYIDSKGLGTYVKISHGRILIRPSRLIAQDFIKKYTMLSFEDNVKLLASELRCFPGRKAQLEELLHQLHIDGDIREYVSYFEDTGIIEITARSKDGHEIFLTRTGMDFLDGRLPQKDSSSTVIYNNVTGNQQVGAQGHNAIAHDNTFNQVNQLPSNFDYDALIQELSQLRIALASSTNREHHMIISEVIQAEVAAETKDGNKVIEYLKRGGKLLWSFSENVGANIVANIMAGQMIG